MSATCFAPRAATRPAIRPRRPMKFTREFTFTGSAPLAGQAIHVHTDGRLPQLLCSGRGHGPRMPRFDAVVTLTTPPIIGLIGTLLRRLKGTSHIYWSMDLHPDASLALRRMSRRNPAVGGLAWLSDHVYRQADRVIVLGPYMADRVLAKGPPGSRYDHSRLEPARRNLPGQSPLEPAPPVARFR